MRGPVFLSYAREDEQWARSVAARLRERSIDVWLDKDSLTVGQNWADQIRHAISNAKLFVAFLSSHSVHERGYVQAELKTAINTLYELPEDEVFILPVRVDDCAVPGRLQHLHYIDLFSEGGLDKLTDAVARLLGEVDAGPPADPSAGALRFVAISIDRSNEHWSEIPRDRRAREGRESPGKVGFFGLRGSQYFHVSTFKKGVDPSFDITVLNVLQHEPVIVTGMGVRWVAYAHVPYIYGIPSAAVIQRSAKYVITCPDIKERYRADNYIWSIPIEETSIDADLLLDDPVYMESQAPFRFSLELRHYFERIPNHSLIRLWVESDHGRDYSNEIELFTL